MRSNWRISVVLESWLLLQELMERLLQRLLQVPSKSQYEETFVVGNIGPYTSKVSEMTEQSVTVAEVSSFQLETIMDFHPDVSAILNLTPDHLDRHGSMENYVRIKECITMNQTAEDAVVLNYDDPLLREFGESRIEETASKTR